jgi:hypothetical protein
MYSAQGNLKKITAGYQSAEHHLKLLLHSHWRTNEWMNTHSHSLWCFKLRLHAVLKWSEVSQNAILRLEADHTQRIYDIGDLLWNHNVQHLTGSWIAGNPWLGDWSADYVKEKSVLTAFLCVISFWMFHRAREVKIAQDDVGCQNSGVVLLTFLKQNQVRGSCE